VVLFGVACELELNGFVDDLLERHEPTARALYDAARYPFHWRFARLPEILGAGSFKAVDADGARLVQALYSLRGTAAHKGELLLNDQPVGFEDVSRFWFVTERFLEWTRAERQRLGIPIFPKLFSERWSSVG
jgi:hypothetical protein